MSTITEQTKNGTKPQAAQQSGQMIEYVPLGETAPITLTLARVKQYLCTPTKSGKMPSDEQVIKFMMMCKAGALNPWVNDAYLVGYDGKDGPQFSLITSHQALLKRAEASHDYDGMESGVIVLRDNVVTERQGDLVLDGETLVGAWAKVYRTDRRIPSYDAINLKNYDKQRSLWNSDKAGMIVKCAEASAMRKAFPSSLAALYCREEMDRVRSDEIHETVDTRSKSDRLAERLITPVATVGESKPVVAIPEKPIEQTVEPHNAQWFMDAIEHAGSRSELESLVDDLHLSLQSQFVLEDEFNMLRNLMHDAQERLK